MSNPSIKVLVDSNSFKDKAAMAAAFSVLQKDLTSYCNAHPFNVQIGVDQAASMQKIEAALQNIKGNLGDRDITFWLDIANEDNFYRTLSQYKSAIGGLIDSVTSHKVRFDLSGIGNNLKNQLTDIFSTLEDREYNIDIHIANKNEFADELEDLGTIWKEFRGSITDITFDTFDDAESIEKFRNEIKLAGETLDGFLNKLRSFRNTYIGMDTDGLTKANLDVSTMGSEMEKAIENVRADMVRYFQSNPLKIPFYIDSLVLADEFEKAQNAYDNFVNAVNSGKIDEQVLSGLEQQATSLRYDFMSVADDINKIKNLTSIDTSGLSDIKPTFSSANLQRLQKSIDNYCKTNPITAPIKFDENLLLSEVNDVLNKVRKKTELNFNISINPRTKTELEKGLTDYKDILKSFGEHMSSLQLTSPLSGFESYINQIDTGLSKLTKKIKAFKSANLYKTVSGAAKGLEKIDLTNAENNKPLEINVVLDPKKLIKAVNTAIASTNIDSFKKVKIGVEVTQESIEQAVQSVANAAKTPQKKVNEDSNDVAKATISIDSDTLAKAQQTVSAYFAEHPLSIPASIDTSNLSQEFEKVQEAYKQLAQSLNSTEIKLGGFDDVSSKVSALVKNLKQSVKELEKVVVSTDVKVETGNITANLNAEGLSGMQTAIDTYCAAHPLSAPVIVDSSRLQQEFEKVKESYTQFVQSISGVEFSTVAFDGLSTKIAELVKNLKQSVKETEKLGVAATSDSKNVVGTGSVKATVDFDPEHLRGIQTVIDTYLFKHPLKIQLKVDSPHLLQEMNTALDEVRAQINPKFTLEFGLKGKNQFKKSLEEYKNILIDFTKEIESWSSQGGMILFRGYATDLESRISQTYQTIQKLRSLREESAGLLGRKDNETTADITGLVEVDAQQIINSVNAAIAETNVDSFDKVKIGVEVTKESVQEAIKNAGLSEITAEVKKALKDAEPKTENKIVKKPSKKAEKVETKTEEPAAAEMIPAYTKEGNLAKLEQYKKQLQNIKDILATTNPDDKLVDNAALANLETAEKALEDLVAQYNRLRNVDKRGALLDGDMASAGGKLGAALIEFEDANADLKKINDANEESVKKFDATKKSIEAYKASLQEIPDEIINKKQLESLDDAIKKFDEAIEECKELTSVTEQNEALSDDGAVGSAVAKMSEAQKALEKSVKESMGKYKNMSTDTFVTNLDKEVTAIQKKMSSLDLQLNDTGFQNKIAEEGVDVERIRNLYNQVLEIRQRIATTDDTNQRERLVNAEKVILTTLQREFTVASNVRTAYAGQIKEQDKVYTSMTKLNTFIEKYKDELSKIPYLWERINRVQSKGSTMDSTSLQKEVDSIIAAAQSFGVQTETMFTRLWARIKFNVRSGLAGWGTMLISTSFRELYNNVKDLDTAMTELRKVTDETEATYTKFLENAADRAQKLGASLTDVVSSTSDFARLGYSLTDATTLSDAATIYLNVGDDVEDIDQATKSIVSTMQGFGLQTSEVMGIVDEFNEVSNNYASSAGDIGEITQRSAAAMAAAGSSLEETIALGVTANTVAQDADTVGTALKTMSMRLKKIGWPSSNAWNIAI